MNHHQNGLRIPDILGAHALSGCDSSSAIFGIGKLTALKTLKVSNLSLNLLGDEQADIDALNTQCTYFISLCYGYESMDMTECRKKVWSRRVGTKSAVKIETLPPTSEYFRLHCLRSHFQVIVWKSALSPHPPNLDPSNYGWSLDLSNKILIATPIPTGTAAAPEEILNLIKCGCASENPCVNNRCSCHKNNIPCTIFCQCQKGGNICLNTLGANADG